MESMQSPQQHNNVHVCQHRAQTTAAGPTECAPGEQRRLLGVDLPRE